MALSLPPLRLSAAVSDKLSKRQACAYIERLMSPLLKEQNATALLAIDAAMVAIFSEIATKTIDHSPFTEVSSAIIGFFISNLLHGTINYHILSDRWVRGKHKMTEGLTCCAHTLASWIGNVMSCCHKRPPKAEDERIILERRKLALRREIFTCLVQTNRLVRQLGKPSTSKIPHTPVNTSLDQIATLSTELARIPTRAAKLSDFFLVSPFIDESRVSTLTTTMGILIYNEIFDPKMNAFAAASSVIFGAIFTCLINLLFHCLNSLFHCDLHRARNDINIKLASDDRDFCRDAIALPGEIRDTLITTQVWRRCESTPKMRDPDREDAFANILDAK